MTLCQSCIERNLGTTVYYCTECDTELFTTKNHIPEHTFEVRIKPNEAIGLWQDLPICNDCLEPLVKNDMPDLVPSVGISDITKAQDILTKVDQLLKEWPLTAEKALTEREQFFIWHAPAIVNIELAELEQIIERRKSFLFASRVLLEPEVNLINKLKSELRIREGITGESVSVKEFTKVRKSASGSKEDKLKAKMAKTLGITVEELDRGAAQARATEFENITGVKADTIGPSVAANVDTSVVLQELKNKIAAGPQELSITSITNPNLPKTCFRCKEIITDYKSHMPICKGSGFVKV